MSAKEMFEKLGYEYKIVDDFVKGKYVKCTREIHITDEPYINVKVITFALNAFIIKNYLIDNLKYTFFKSINNISINYDELQAINKQLEEQGRVNE